MAARPDSSHPASRARAHTAVLLSAAAMLMHTAAAMRLLNPPLAPLTPHASPHTSLATHAAPTRRARVASAPPLCRVSDRSEAEAALFDELLRSAGNVDPPVRLRGSRSDSSRALVASRELSAGDTIVVAPAEVLLTAHRSGVVRGLIGQTDAMLEATGDLRHEVGKERFKHGATWDVRLSLGVFEATAGCGGAFWDRYRQLLPLPPFSTSAASLPMLYINELQDPVLEQRAKQKAAVLAELYPSLASHAVHPVTARYESMGAPLDMIPLPLQWTYAMVVSRCFAMDDGDTFAFVPFIDMCQHSANPAANFSTTASGGFELTALRPIREGESISISYDGNEYDSRRMFELYGFVPAEGKAEDAELLHATVSAAASATNLTVQELAERGAAGGSTAQLELSDVERLRAAFDAHRDSPYASAPRFAALFDALTEPDAPPAAAFLASARWQRQAWPTTIEKDLQDLLQLQQLGPEGDQRLAAVLSYRIARKKQLALAEDVLNTFLRGDDDV